MSEDQVTETERFAAAKQADVEFGRLAPGAVALRLPPNYAVTAAWGRFKTTNPDDYFLAARLASNSASVEVALFDMFLRGWVYAGGKVG